MNEQGPRLWLYRTKLPLWLVLAIAAPLGAVFLTSLLLALVVLIVGGAAAAMLLPFLFRRPPVPQGPDTIELDSSQYRRIQARPRDRT